MRLKQVIFLKSRDSKLKGNYNYKDDFETFKMKLECNKSKIDNSIEYKELNTETTEWNQFSANKEKSEIIYKEELYTTELDPEVIPEEYKQNAENITKVCNIIK